MTAFTAETKHTYIADRSTQLVSNLLPAARSSTWEFHHQPAEETQLVFSPISSLRTDRQSSQRLDRVEQNQNRSSLTPDVSNQYVINNLLLGGSAVLQPVVHLLLDVLDRCGRVIALGVVLCRWLVNGKLHLRLLHLRPLLSWEG